MARRVCSALKGFAAGLVGAGLLMMPMAGRAKADLWNQKTAVRLNQPVEIPGRVLGPGSYVFKLANLPSDRNVVQIFNHDQTRLLATEMTIPAYRLNPTGKTVITFEERAVNGPQAVHDWFYPGMQYGHQFVYNR